MLFKGYPKETPDIVIGRILGLLDAAAMMVLNYWLGTSNSSQQDRKSTRLNSSHT